MPDHFGPTLNLHYHPRTESNLSVAPRTAPIRGKHTNPGPTQGVIELNADERLTERGLMRGVSDTSPLTSPNEQNQVRLMALHAFNDLAQRIGDIMTGHRSVVLRDGEGRSLSSSGISPDGTTEGLPVAVQIGDQERHRGDTRWLQFFTVEDLRQNSHPYFKIADTYNAITFSQYQLGDRIEMGFVQTDEAIYEAAIYAAAMQWNTLWADWQSLWQQGDGLAAMQSKYLNFQARTAYKIVTNPAGIETISYQGDTGDSQTRRDIKTLNEGVRKIKEQLFKKEGPDGEPLEEDLENETFYAVYDSLQSGLKERIENALEVRLSVDGDGKAEVTEVKYNIVPIGTPYVDGVTTVLPGRKNVLGLSRDLTFYDVLDPRIAGVAEGSVAQSAWRMVRGSSEQSVKNEMADA